MAQNHQQIQLAKQAEQAVRAKRAVTAQQAERAKQASRAIRIDELKYLRKQNSQVETFLANYNDPTELNSFIDALTNREAVSKKFGETWGTISTASGTVAVLSFAGALITQAVGALLAPATGGASVLAAQPISAGLSKVGAVAAIPAIPAALDVSWNYGIKPIVSGKPKEALLNTFINLGETMDYVTNPIKGLIHEGGEGFIKGTGLADGGRVNYDFDTGFFLTDMLLEIVVDPMNWVDLGTSVALRSKSKIIAKEAIERISQNTVKTVNIEFAETVGKITTKGAERITKSITNAVSKITRNLAEASVKNLSQAAQQNLIKQVRVQIQQAFVQALKKELPRATATQLDLILRQTGRDVITRRFTKSAYNAIQNITWDTLSTDVIKSLAGIQHYSNTFQKFMTKGAMLTSGYGLGVGAAISGWKGVKRWANRFTVRQLRNLTEFNPVSGLDIKRLPETKAIWDASEKYTTIVSGQAAQMDLGAFYEAVTELFARDKALLSKTIQNNTNPLKLASALDAQLQNLHGVHLTEYVKLIKNFNKLEDGMYDNYVSFLQNLVATLKSNAFTKPLGAKFKSGTQLFKAPSNKQLIAQIRKASQTPKSLNLVEQVYTLKRNNALVTQELLNIPEVHDTLTKVHTNTGVGALLRKIEGDLNTLAPDVNPLIADGVRTIKQSAASYLNTRELYDNVAKLPITLNVKGVSPNDFKKYIIDQIFGKQPNVVDLLANFDNITMPSLKNGLEVILADTGFKFKDHPVLELQIARVYKQFLEAQQQAGIVDLKQIFGDKFVNAVNDLIKYLPDYRRELSEIANINGLISSILKTTKSTNKEFLTNVLTDKNTILNLTNTRKLTDAGYAFDIIAVKKNLALFEFPDEVQIQGKSVLVNSAENIGKIMNELLNSLKQYEVYFTPRVIRELNKAYSQFRYQFINKADVIGSLKNSAFRYVRFTKDPLEQFTQLVTFNKLSKSKIIARRYQLMLNKTLSPKVRMNIMRPEQLLTTGYAWQPFEQTAWAAKAKLKEEQINTLDAFRNLSLVPKKLGADFANIRYDLSLNKLDRPKLLQQERYIKRITPVHNTLEFIENYYYGLFDKKLAEKEVEYLRNILNNFPDLNTKYSTLVDDLEAYWNGEKIFKQPKFKGDTSTPDEFTPFWSNLKRMLGEIQETLTEHNANSPNKFQFKMVTPWDPFKKQQAFNKQVAKATNAHAKGAFYDLFRLSPEDLTNELAYRFRVISFKFDDINDDKLKILYNTLKKNTPEYIKFITDPTDPTRVYIVLDKSQKINIQQHQIYLNTRPIAKPIRQKQFNELKIIDDIIEDPKNPGIVNMLNNVDKSIYELTGKHLGDSQGEYLTKDTLLKLYVERFPQEVRDALPPLEEWLQDDFFKVSTFNESFLGSMHNKRDLGLSSSNIIINIKNALIKSELYTKTKNEYINSVFDSMLSLSSPNSIWKSLSNEDLLEALQTTPDYKLTTLIYDKKYGLKVREILPTSVEVIAKVKETGGWVLPLQTYKDMVNVVNHRVGAEGFLKLWARIIYLLKAGYLMTPGAWTRNFIDTNVKGLLDTQDATKTYLTSAKQILTDVNALKTSLKASEELSKQTVWKEYGALATKLLNEKDSIDKYILAKSKEGYIQTVEIQKWFAEGNAKYLTYEAYTELESDFLSQGISGNIMADLYTTEGGGVWRTVTEMTGNVIEAGNKIENYVRLADYLYYLDHGADYTSALAKLAKTHFDYSYKSAAEQYAELLFPFTTFSLRNFSYWIEQIEKHPWIMRNYAHLMEPHWDFKDYTPEELATNRRVQNQILYGQLKIAEFNDKLITFKVNPSIQDAIQMFSDPINNIYEKLAAPIAYPIDELTGEYTNPTSLLPIAGPIVQNVQTMIRTGSPIPSMLGVQPIPKRTGRAELSGTYSLPGTDKYTDSTYRTPKYRNNVVYDHYAKKGISRYRLNMYPIIDIAHDVKMRHTTNVYNRIKNRVKIDVYKGVRYNMRLDVNRFR